MDESIIAPSFREDDGAWLMAWLEEVLDETNGPERWVVIRLMEQLALSLARTG